MDNNSAEGCCGTSGCCSLKQERKQITIDFLYLDLSICERCQGTETNLEAAINEVSTVLKAAGYDIVMNKINITSKEMAIKYMFISSPTIRVNGHDIEVEIKETACKDCGDLCGDSVECRVWIYNGEVFNEPPKELIINAILKEVYSGYKSINLQKNGAYKLPQNLENFFDGLENKKA